MLGFGRAVFRHPVFIVGCFLHVLKYLPLTKRLSLRLCGRTRGGKHCRELGRRQALMEIKLQRDEVAPLDDKELVRSVTVIICEL